MVPHLSLSKRIRSFWAGKNVGYRYTAGSQHNVVPASCNFVVDVRVTDAYRNEEVLEIIRQHVSCDVTPRSIRLKPSKIDKGHPIVQAGIALGRTTYGSPTTSDQSLLDIPSLKVARATPPVRIQRMNLFTWMK